MVKTRACAREFPAQESFPAKASDGEPSGGMVEFPKNEQKQVGKIVSKGRGLLFLLCFFSFLVPRACEHRAIGNEEGAQKEW